MVLFGGWRVPLWIEMVHVPVFKIFVSSQRLELSRISRFRHPFLTTSKSRSSALDSYLKLEPNSHNGFSLQKENKNPDHHRDLIRGRNFAIVVLSKIQAR